ncbi:MAG: hypothetical protein Q8P83_00150 [bacterium]|nr:hypothetical protein [bacterium]
MDLWIFDNDGTLYNDGAAYGQFQDLFLAFIPTLRGVDEARKQQLLMALRNKTGISSALFALHRDMHLDFDATIAATYLRIDLDKCQITSPDLERKKALESIRAEKVVFTNNASAHALRVLRYVGLDTCFSRIIGIQETGGLSKPDHKAFRFVHELFPGYDRKFFCDDKREFLDVARDFGWHTIWYQPSVDIQVYSPHRIIRSFAELVI